MRISVTTISAMAALFPVSASAMVDEFNSSGETTLQTTQSGFDIRIQNADNPGTSARVEVRPRNSNCVAASSTPVTYSGSYMTTADDIMHPVEAGASTISSPYLHNNPGCIENQWGYFSVNVIESSTQTYKIHGTLKSYKIEITFGEMSGNTVISKLRTD